MKLIFNLLILLTIIFSASATAGSITKCIDADGTVRFTDKGCTTKESQGSLYISGQNTKTSAQSQIKAVRYRVQDIGYLTAEAEAQCSKKASEYFLNNYPDVKADTESEFLNIADRSIKSTEVEIILSGFVRYKVDENPTELSIQCTAIKSGATNQWTLVFKETK